MFQEANRIAYIDLAKGFCIVLVVLFHAKGVLDVHYASDAFLASFRLPLYFFLSGLFFKDYGSFSRFVIKKVNRLLVPFFCFYLCFSVCVPNLLHDVLGIHFDTVVGWPSLWAFLWPGQYPNIPIWFLWCLFLMNVLFWIIYTTSNRYDGPCSIGILILLCVACGFMGSQLMDNQPTDYGNVFKALQSMPFFCFGYLLKHYDGLQRIQGMSRFSVLFSMLLFLGLTLFFTFYYPLYFTAGITGTLFILLMARLMGRLPFFSYVGRYSIMLLLTHGLLIRALTPLCLRLSETTGPEIAVFLLFLTVLMSYYLLIPLMQRFLPYVTAQKPLFRE